jgi:predicted O-methyltransferase YrrM
MQGAEPWEWRAHLRVFNSPGATTTRQGRAFVDTANSYLAWFKDGEYTSDWTSTHFDVWAKLLEPLRDRAVDILEVGAFEGRSAVFFLEYLPLSRIVCIDRFESEMHPGYDVRFRRNTRRYGRRVEAIRTNSIKGLQSLLPNARRFDLIYIDGSHARDDVLIDSLLCWRLLRIGGIMIWDDYKLSIDPYKGPREAIDQALNLYEGALVELHKAEQVIIRKTGERRSFYQARPRANAITLKRFFGGRLGVARTPANLLRVLLSRIG